MCLEIKESNHIALSSCMFPCDLPLFMKGTCFLLLLCWSLNPVFICNKNTDYIFMPLARSQLCNLLLFLWLLWNPEL